MFDFHLDDVLVFVFAVGGIEQVVSGTFGESGIASGAFDDASDCSFLYDRVLDFHAVELCSGEVFHGCHFLALCFCRSMARANVSACRRLCICCW